MIIALGLFFGALGAVIGWQAHGLVNEIRNFDEYGRPR